MVHAYHDHRMVLCDALIKRDFTQISKLIQRTKILSMNRSKRSTTHPVSRLFLLNSNEFFSITLKWLLISIAKQKSRIKITFVDKWTLWLNQIYRTSEQNFKQYLVVDRAIDLFISKKDHITHTGWLMCRRVSVAKQYIDVHAISTTISNTYGLSALV